MSRSRSQGTEVTTVTGAFSIHNIALSSEQAVLFELGETFA